MQEEKGEEKEFSDDRRTLTQTLLSVFEFESTRSDFDLTLKKLRSAITAASRRSPIRTTNVSPRKSPQRSPRGEI